MLALSNFRKILLIDTGFWFALYKPKDQHHREAIEKSEILNTCNLIIPWPCLYETFNTQFAKNKAAVLNFEQLLKQPHVVRLPDEPYREQALESAISLANGTRYLSLVDVVIRLILDDVNVRKHGLLTFNQGDFADICRQHGLEML